MANAVVQAAREHNLLHEEMHSEVEYLVAHGISSKVNDQRVIIGSAHFVFEDEGCIVPPEEQAQFDALPPEYSHLYLAIGGVLAAVICIADPLREEADAVIYTLRCLGITKTIMLTGDSERTAAAIAAQIGVDEYHAEVLPEDKAHFVEEERAQGHTVIMLGDGINDSPALSTANVGIAISDGAAIAREIADITISADNLYQLVSLRIIASSLMRRIRSNYRFVIGFNGGLIALGAAGLLLPSTSALLHNLSTLGVSLRSMTDLLGAPPKPMREDKK
jgi:P-type E1-E2 ATPase